MVVGCASSNVFDGDKDLGDNFIVKGIKSRGEVGFLTFFEHFGQMTVGKYLKDPPIPIWIICSESHYSILFGSDMSVTQPKGEQPKQFDLIYYDELARQDDDIILTVDLTKKEQKSKYTIPIDSVIRTKWGKTHIDWNGRT